MVQSGGLHLCVNVAQRLSNNFSHIVKMSKFSLKGFKISEFWRSTLSNAIGAILGFCVFVLVLVVIHDDALLSRL